MGQKLACRLRLGRRVLTGKAYLETDHLLFRGEERIKIPFQELAGVTAAEGQLHLEYAAGPAALELGPAAARWAEKILHPPTRAAKLGIKPDLAYRLAGEFADDFLAELAPLPQASSRAKADLVFLHARRRNALVQLPKLKAGLNAKGALWIVYPKGNPDIREVEVIEAGRAAGLKDVKVIRFSATYTALKFVVPASQGN